MHQFRKKESRLIPSRTVQDGFFTERHGFEKQFAFKANLTSEEVKPASATHDLVITLRTRDSRLPLIVRRRGRVLQESRLGKVLTPDSRSPERLYRPCHGVGLNYRLHYLREEGVIGENSA